MPIEWTKEKKWSTESHLWEEEMGSRPQQKAPLFTGTTGKERMDIDDIKNRGSKNNPNMDQLKNGLNEVWYIHTTGIFGNKK